MKFPHNTRTRGIRPELADISCLLCDPLLRNHVIGKGWRAPVARFNVLGVVNRGASGCEVPVPDCRRGNVDRGCDASGLPLSFIRKEEEIFIGFGYFSAEGRTELMAAVLRKRSRLKERPRIQVVIARKGKCRAMERGCLRASSRRSLAPPRSDQSGVVCVGLDLEFLDTVEAWRVVLPACSELHIQDAVDHCRV